MKKHSVLAMLAIIAFVLIGCDNSKTKTSPNLDILGITSEPVVSASRDPDIDFSKYKVITIVLSNSVKDVPPAFGDDLIE